MSGKWAEEMNLQPNDLVGMSLRDYFAGKVINNIIQETENFSVNYMSEKIGIRTIDYNHDIHFYKFCAMTAYKIADAMLAEREK